MFGSSILSLTKHWCKSKEKMTLLKLSLVVPHDVAVLSLQVPMVQAEVFYRGRVRHFRGRTGRGRGQLRDPTPVILEALLMF
jgi:hypothetical protein